MRPSRRTFCRSLLAAAGLPAFVSRARAADGPDTAALDAAVRDALRTWKVPGAAVAVVRDGDVLYLKGHGLKELDGTDAVMPDTLFPVGSCTKTFTTAALAILVDEGKVGWDDPVRKHLPTFRLSDPLADREVVLRDLLCHRTGLGSNDLLWYRSPFTPEEAVRRAGFLPLEFPFRTHFRYQTTMFTAAGLAVAAASGKPWDEFVQGRLLDPLGMAATCFTSKVAAKAADHSGGHRLNRLGRPEAVPWYTTEAPEPATSMWSSARDLARWLRFQLGGGTADGKRLVSADALGETHTPQMVIRLEGSERDLQPETQQMSYGMAWVIQDYRGVGLWSHAGVIDGFRAHLTLAPRQQIGIAILANLYATRMNLALSNTLLDLLLGLPRKDWNAVLGEAVRKAQEAEADKRRAREARRRRDTKPSHELAAYVGAYDHPAYGTAKVTLEKGGLVWSWGQLTSPMEHFQYDAFDLSLQDLPAEAVFTPDADGAVGGLKVSEPMNAEFRRQGAG
jgi:CubicO group peptidase (beta-lactamase class C family)